MNTSDTLSTLENAQFEILSQLPRKLPKTIHNLHDEADVLNALNQYRENNNLAKARNCYSWWKYVLTALLVNKSNKTNLDGISLKEAVEMVESCMGVKVTASATLLTAAADGESPDHIRREYTGLLPTLVKVTGLTYKSDSKRGNKGRSGYLFYYKNPEFAQKVLFQIVPETKILFNTLKKSKIMTQRDNFNKLFESYFGHKPA